MGDYQVGSALAERKHHFGTLRRALALNQKISQTAARGLATSSSRRLTYITRYASNHANLKRPMAVPIPHRPMRSDNRFLPDTVR